MLKVAREEKQNKKKIMEKQKAKIMTVKQCKAREIISSLSKKKNECNTGDDIDTD